MHRSTHKMLTVVFALLLAVIASEALADGSRGHGPRSYGSGNHGSRHYGSRQLRRAGLPLHALRFVL